MTFDYRLYTEARVALGHTGAGLPTKAWLLFSYHHACAVDAINAPWDIEQQTKDLKELGLSSVVLETKVANREQYLLRPDLGCLLHDRSIKYLKSLPKQSPDILIVASNGLSSFAVANHLTNFLRQLLVDLAEAGFSLAYNCIFLTDNARVALIDSIGALLKPKIGLMLIGERPGLSSPDSLAAYLTYAPKRGRSPAERNCISNIRPPFGLSYEHAEAKAIFLIKEALRRKLSGVALKEDFLPQLPK
jgi:ethanolamine ammonia-lyase small subunit